MLGRLLTNTQKAHVVYLTAQDCDALSENTNHLISKTSWELKTKQGKAP